MYALVDPKSFWPQPPAMSTLQPNQIYMAPVPITPTYLIGGTPSQVFPMAPPANQSPAATMPPTATPMYFGFQPNWAQNQPCVPAILPQTRQRISSDDVFILDNQANHTNNARITIPSKDRPVNFRPRRRQRVTGAADVDDILRESVSPSKGKKHRERARPMSCATSSDSSSNEFSPQRSLDSGRSSGSSSLRSSISPKYVAKNSGKHVSMDHSSTSESHKEATSNDINDISLFNIFSTSLYSALTRDPPEPTVASDSENDLVIPLKTSSPIHGGDSLQNALQNEKMTKRTTTVNRDDRLEYAGHDNFQEEQLGNRRQKFLRSLEEERERQRCLVLPRHAPKMTCKFCKNNGESLEIYTKHRLHFNEKTVCPLLRMYVCRLCNSTGDFAHTIRHCPFNSRFDKVAWKATFL